MDEFRAANHSAANFEAEPLSTADIDQLELFQNRCSSADWANVKILPQGRLTLKNIRCCSFNPGAGTILIGAMEGVVDINAGVRANAGLINSHFYGDCILSSGILVQDTSMLSNVFIGPESVVLACGQILGCNVDSKEGSTYGNFTTIHVGPETGGRNVIIHIDQTYPQLCKLALNIADSNGEGDVAFSEEPSRFHLTVIGSRAAVVRCDLVRCSLIGAGARVHSSVLEHCTLASSSTRPVRVSGGAHLSRCLMQEGSVAEHGCRADGAMLCESSSLGENARVSQSILGPDSSVAGGECHHSLLGPFVGFHHHSLLIASVWPTGRGNLGYGAMVGANHTGRVNDQECWPGEGCFFGLGSALKFPVNLVDSPYSIVAPRTTLGPQVLRFPFSLVLELTPAAGDAAACTSVSGHALPVDACLIKPAWVLYGNPYMLDRWGGGTGGGA